MARRYDTNMPIATNMLQFCYRIALLAGRAETATHGIVYGMLQRFGQVQFDSKIATFAPAEVKIEPAALVRKKRQQRQFASSHRKIPAAVWIRIPLRPAPAAVESFVRHTNDVVIEIVKRIAQAPQKTPLPGIRAIPRRRHRVVNVPEPPNRVELVVEWDVRVIGRRRHGNGVPATCLLRRTFHGSGLPRRRDGPRKNSCGNNTQQRNGCAQAVPQFYSAVHDGILSTANGVKASNEAGNSF